MQAILLCHNLFSDVRNLPGVLDQTGYHVLEFCDDRVPRVLIFIHGFTLVLEGMSK